MTDRRPNRLADQTSPYLLQHADNPVDWHPWSDEALELARRQKKPVLLSIGYSACHWCHVMAHESFENDEIASLMNELFVNIKVDREERPDLDKLYQVAHQLLTQQPGGWPLTVFIDPSDKLPFFAGTYFPPTARYGRPGFPEVLRRVADFYREQHAEIAAQKAPIVDVFERIDGSPTATGELNMTPAQGLQRELAGSYDARHGGFGAAPKFPHPASLERLLAHWASSRDSDEVDDRALEMATHTLQAMIRGGLYDQLGGGFYRYSVDAQWQIPHFEKMLYDNGPLLALCAQAWAATGQELFRRAATETADWVQREMQAADGGYYATLDADSEGVEGKFYVWTAEQARAIVDDDAWPLVAAHLGLDGEPNFEGKHHLYQARSTGQVAAGAGSDAADTRKLLDGGRAALLQARAKRVWPGRDEKILTSWNGLMIRGMAIAARALSRPDCAASATRAVDFIHSTLWHDGRLLATYKDGKARLNAYLDDYAHLCDALVELLQARWRTRDLEFATALADAMLGHFEDTERGGFFFTSDDHEELFHRPRPFGDDATPAGNAIAARALTRLGYLLGENRYLDAAERTLRAGWEGMRSAPSGHASLVGALSEFLHPPAIAILRGDPQRLEAAARELDRLYKPDQLAFAIGNDIDDLPEALAVRAPRGDFVAYLCRGHTCTVADDLAALTPDKRD